MTQDCHNPPLGFSFALFCSFLGQKTAHLARCVIIKYIYCIFTNTWSVHKNINVKGILNTQWTRVTNESILKLSESDQLHFTFQTVILSKLVF